jgi:hypothetical protein
MIQSNLDFDNAYNTAVSAENVKDWNFSGSKLEIGNLVLDQYKKLQGNVEPTAPKAKAKGRFSKNKVEKGTPKPKGNPKSPPKPKVNPKKEEIAVPSPSGKAKKYKLPDGIKTVGGKATFKQTENGPVMERSPECSRIEVLCPPKTKGKVIGPDRVACEEDDE